MSAQVFHRTVHRTIGRKAQDAEDCPMHMPAEPEGAEQCADQHASLIGREGGRVGVNFISSWFSYRVHVSAAGARGHHRPAWRKVTGGQDAEDGQALSRLH